MAIDISIIVVSFNTKEILEKCLNSLKKYTDQSAEVIVVDNNSNDGSVSLVKSFKSIKLIENKTNAGFAKANNQGIEASKGRYILLLNSDTYLHENSVTKMFSWMDKHPDVGIASCKLLNPDGTLQPTGGFFPELGRLFLWATFLDDLALVTNLFGSYHPDKSWYTGVKYLDWVTGAFFLMRREAVQKTGKLDEKIFMYGEDLELCYRAKQETWKVAYVPETAITHIGRASGSSEGAILGEFRGLIYFYKKHKSKVELLFAKCLMWFAALLRIILYTLMGKFNLAKIYAKTLSIN